MRRVLGKATSIYVTVLSLVTQGGTSSHPCTLGHVAFEGSSSESPWCLSGHGRCVLFEMQQRKGAKQSARPRTVRLRHLKRRWPVFPKRYKTLRFVSTASDSSLVASAFSGFSMQGSPISFARSFSSWSLVGVIGVLQSIPLWQEAQSCEFCGPAQMKWHVYPLTDWQYLPCQIGTENFLRL